MARGIVTGSVFRRHSFDYTSVRDLSVVGRKPKDMEPAVPNLYEQINAVSGKLKGELHYGLAADRTLLRIVDLPSDDPEEIEGMVDLQIDKITPFPVESMYVSYEVIHQADGVSRVLLAAVQKKWVDHAGDSFQEAGLALRRVDIDVLGWLHMLKREDRLPTEGRHLILFFDEAGTELVLIEDGLPLAFRSLGIQDEDESEEEFLDEVTEEFEYSMAAFEGEWGGQPVQSLTLWHWGTPPQRISRLGEATGVLLQTESFETLGSLSEGIALRAAESNQPLLNLAPESWLERIKSQGLMRNMMIAGLTLLAILLLYIAGLNLFNRKLQNDLAQTSAEAQLLEAPVEEYGRVNKDVRFLKSFTDRSNSSLETIKNMTDAMPEGIEVASITYEKDEAAVKIKGSCMQTTPIYAWMQNLSNTGKYIIPNDTSVTANKIVKGKNDFSFDVLIKDMAVSGEDA